MLWCAMYITYTIACNIYGLLSSVSTTIHHDNTQYILNILNNKPYMLHTISWCSMYTAHDTTQYIVLYIAYCNSTMKYYVYNTIYYLNSIYIVYSIAILHHYYTQYIVNIKIACRHVKWEEIQQLYNIYYSM